MRARRKESDRTKRDKKLDQALKMTFPANDPIAVGHPTGTEVPTALVPPTRTWQYGRMTAVIEAGNAKG